MQQNTRTAEIDHQDSEDASVEQYMQQYEQNRRDYPLAFLKEDYFEQKKSLETLVQYYRDAKLQLMYAKEYNAQHYVQHALTEVLTTVFELIAEALDEDPVTENPEHMLEEVSYYAAVESTYFTKYGTDLREVMRQYAALQTHRDDMFTLLRQRHHDGIQFPLKRVNIIERNLEQFREYIGQLYRNEADNS